MAMASWCRLLNVPLVNSTSGVKSFKVRLEGRVILGGFGWGSGVVEGGHERRDVMAVVFIAAEYAGDIVQYQDLGMVVADLLSEFLEDRGTHQLVA